jgi:hypothetical protein
VQNYAFSVEYARKSLFLVSKRAVFSEPPSTDLTFFKALFFADSGKCSNFAAQNEKERRNTDVSAAGCAGCLQGEEG